METAAILAISVLKSAHVGEAVLLTSQIASGLIMSVGACALAFLGVIVIAGVTYCIFKKLREINSYQPYFNSNSSFRLSISSHFSQIEQRQTFIMPKVSEQQSISSFSEALTITTSQVEEFEQVYSCPISFSIMTDPVMALCSKCTKKRNYQKIMIQAWINQKGACPICRGNLSKDDLIQNDGLKQSIKILRKQLTKRAQKIQQQRIKNDELE